MLLWRRLSICVGVLMACAQCESPAETESTPLLSAGDEGSTESVYAPNRSQVIKLINVSASQLHLPEEPEDWHLDPDALARALRDTNGAVLIGFKERESPRTVENDGYRRGVSASTVSGGIDRFVELGGHVTHVWPRLGAIAGTMSGSRVREVFDDELFDYIDPAFPLHLSGVRGRDRSATNMLSQITAWGVDLVGAPDAWSKSKGDGAKILFIDTGHDQGHEDLPSVPSSNCGGDEDGCTDHYQIPHGTFVMGNAAARDNAYGVVGVAPDIDDEDVYSWGACGPYGSPVCSPAEVIDGIQEGIEWDVDVINMSLELGDTSIVGLADGVNDAFGEDIVLVASAGNNCGNCMRYPAGYIEVIGVSGVKPDKSFATSSPCSLLLGGSASSNYGLQVSLTAPFWSVSTAYGDTYEDQSDSDHWCGTSFGAPMVSAAAALIRSVAPYLQNYKIYDRLNGTAEDFGAKRV